MDIRQYSEAKIGQQWSETDHLFVVTQLDKADRLAQQVYDRIRETSAAGRTTGEAEICRVKINC